jgi:hypothetical protein
LERFAAALDRYLEKWERHKGTHHDQIRDDLLSFLREVFPKLEELGTVEIEHGVRLLKVRGYIDLLIGDIVFEIKRNLEREREDGIQELEKYLPALPHPENTLGIITDGRRFEVYRLQNGNLSKTDEFVLRAEAPEKALLWLDSYLFQRKGIEPTVLDISFRFGQRSPIFKAAMEALSRMWALVKGDPAARTKFEEWDALLRTVYGSAVGETELFLRHTYLALLVRLLAFSALTGRSPSPEDLEGIVTGKRFERMGFKNLVEEDFFSWPTMPQVAPEAESFLGAIARRLSFYDLSAIRQDLLKELYQELVDPETRHDLGEFYTPDWLAELALREAGFPGKGNGQRFPSLLDPACGSGTFLFTAVRLLREAGLSREALVQHAFENLAGVDVHPLAVLTAKVNLLLALAPELRSLGSLHLSPIPVYMANSLHLPERKMAGAPIAVPIHSVGLPKFPRGVPDRFEVPAEMVAAGPTAVDAVIDQTTELAAQPGQLVDSLLSGLRAYLKELGLGKFYMWWAGNLRLLHFLIAERRDTVYRFILKNAFRPAFLAERKFDFVCGNPPWLVYRSIRDRAYQRMVKDLVFQLGLLERGEVKLFTQMELATLFFAFSHVHYLHDGGTIAFVMPRSVLTGAKQHRHFQQKDLGVVRVIDCEDVEPLFNVPSCVIMARKGAKSDWPVGAVKVSGRLPVRNLSLEKAREYLSFEETSFAPPFASTGPASPYLDKFIQGATIVPRCFWFVRPTAEAWVIDPQRPALETDPEIQKQAKKPWKGLSLSGEVEADFLFATLLGADMIPFGYVRQRLVVLPLEVKPDGKGQLITAEVAIKLGKTGLANWLRKAEAFWEQLGRRTERVRTIYKRLDFQQNLRRQRPVGTCKVLYNTSGTYLCSCVVDASNSNYWANRNIRPKGFAAESKTYWLETDNAEEAHYLCAILNTPFVDEVIKPFQTKGSFGARDIHRRPFEVLPIPFFDSADERHIRLANLSRACHQKVAQAIAEGKLPTTGPIGRLRQKVREFLSTELSEIDRLTQEILRERG